MSKKSRKRIVSPKPEEERISFQVWFQKKLLTKELNSWNFEEIKSYFLANNLSEFEDPNKYNKLLEKY